MGKFFKVNSNHQEMIGLSDNNLDLVRKQREELILLTNLVKKQQEEIEFLNSDNLKLKETVKIFEKQRACMELDTKKIKNELNENLIRENKETKSLKQKISQKDLYIQNQSKKIIQFQANIEKYNQEINNFQQTSTVLKTENSNLQFKLKEYLNRLHELKETNGELMRIIETKNNLIKSSSEHIQKLEKNLKYLVEFDLIKSVKTCSPSDNIKCNKNDINNEPITNNESTFQKSKTMESNSNDLRLISTIQSFKETWLESNLKYEEVLNILSSKLPHIVNSTSADCDSLMDLSMLSRICTSSPIINKIN